MNEEALLDRINKAEKVISDLGESVLKLGAVIVEVERNCSSSRMRRD